MVKQAAVSIADQTLRNWIKQAQIDRGEREGLTTEEREELRRLRRENSILRQEREILKKASRPSSRRRKTGHKLSAFRLIEAEKAAHSVPTFAGFSGLSQWLLRLEEQITIREIPSGCCFVREDRDDLSQ